MSRQQLIPMKGQPCQALEQAAKDAARACAIVEERRDGTLAVRLLM